MRISPEIRVNPRAVKYSLCGKYVAFGHSDELTVIEALELVTVFKVSCSDKITAVDWSPDSDHVLCVIPSRNSVEAFSLSSPEWTCVIKENACGLSSAVWSPAATHIVTVAEHAVRLSVWALVRPSVAFIETPLMKAKDKLAFSPSGNHLAVPSGRPGEYAIELYSTSSWIVSKRIACTDEISMPRAPLWSPTGCHIAVWETLDLRKSILEIYSTATGEKVGHFANRPRNRRGGISSVTWCPNGQFLLISCHDESIYVLNYITWSVIGVFAHRKVVTERNCEILQQRECGGEFAELLERPVKFTFVAPRRRLPGVTRICFGSDGVRAASQTALLPALAWVWNLEEFALTAIVIFRYEITDLRWSPSSVSFLACGRSNRASVWRPGFVSGLELDVHVRGGAWSPLENRQFILFSFSSMRIVSDFE